MKVLIIAGLAESLINFRGQLIADLQAKGCVVHVAAPDLPVGDSFRCRLEEMGLVVHNLVMKRAGTNPFVDCRTLINLLSVIRSTRPDIVFAYTVKPVIYGMIASWLLGVPKRVALITGLGYAFQGDTTRSRVQKVVQRLYSVALGKTHVVFFQNPDDRDLFLEKDLLQTTESSFVVEGSGVDLAHFAPRRACSQRPHFLFIGRLLGDKGVREYTEACKRLTNRFSDITCTLVGWRDENPDSIAANELDVWNCSPGMQFLGKLDDVRAAIANCTVYVLPSYREGTPRTVLEAMSMGKAIITTDAPGCRETVVDGDNGFLVDVQSADAVELAMERFVTQPGLALKMGERSRKYAETKYDVHKVNAKMVREMGLND